MGVVKRMPMVAVLDTFVAPSAGDTEATEGTELLPWPPVLFESLPHPPSMATDAVIIPMVTSLVMKLFIVASQIVCLSDLSNIHSTELPCGKEIMPSRCSFDLSRNARLELILENQKRMTIE